MKKIISMFAVLVVAVSASNASAAVLTWTNGGGDNDFANNANWNSPFAADNDYQIHLAGVADRAVLSTTLPAGAAISDLYVAAHLGTGDGELLVTGGNNVVIRILI
ncbi:MAG: hypothetical protein GXP26_01760 [Planctomycetes bacterium]|nr:hypothetical protein [Planctomycetota bacterium]